MTKKTRDTLYEYIYLTSIESNVARHPLFIRSHYIHQNSFTYLTYPTAHMQRHPHSLGTMHVAGEMLIAAMQNTLDVKMVDQLLLDADDAISEGENKKIDAVEKELKGLELDRLETNESLFRSVPSRFDFSSDIEEEHIKRRIGLICLFQATRLAALLHDVGHPPFSHIVEYGLQSALPNDYTSHEKVGVELSQLIFEDIRNPNSIYSSDTTSKYPKFTDYVLQLAIAILSAKPGSPIHLYKASILDGDFDADRLDYVRRDIQSTGMTTTTYDLGRILDSLHISENDGTSGGMIKRAAISLSPRALSSVETFFIARFHLYRWAIFHHDVTRRNLCMQRFVYIFLTSAELSERLTSLRDSFKGMACDPSQRRRYKYFTDGRFVEMLWKVWDYCEAQTDLTRDEEDLQYFSDIVLNRNNLRMRTLWKRPDHHLEFCRSLSDRLKIDCDENDLILGANRTLMDLFSKYVSASGKTKEVARYTFCQELEKIASNHLPGTAHRLFVNYNASFRAGPSSNFSLISRDNSEAIPLETVSPSVASLSDSWNRSPHLMVFYRPVRTRNSAEEKRIHVQYRNAIVYAIYTMIADYDKMSG